MRKSMNKLFLVMGISIVIAMLWDKIPIIKQLDHAILDPTAGSLFDWNVYLGMIIFVAVVSLFLTLIRKYTMDHESLKEIKKEQKILKEQMKEFRDNPTKLLELQKKQLQFIPKTMDITMKPMMYTSIPIILMFRWFRDYFIANPVKFFGVSWFIAYIILSIVFMSVFRRVFKLP